MCRIIAQNIKNAYLTVSDFQNFPGEHAPDPPRKARASPSQWSLRDHSLSHITSQVSRLQLSKSWQVCSPGLLGHARIHHSSHEIATQLSLSVNGAALQAKMTSNEFSIPWHYAYRHHCFHLKREAFNIEKTPGTEHTIFNDLLS